MNRKLENFVIANPVVRSTALLALLLATIVLPALSANLHSSSASVVGVVRDSAGIPQMGIAVELLRSDSSVVSRVFTDQKGGFSIASVLPGQYALRAAGASFIPMLKQNLRVRANTIVNLTISNLYDLMQIGSQPQRPRAENVDDWAWTLRSAASRPLLRWLDDGSPIVVWDGATETTAAAQRESRLSDKNRQNHRERVLATTGGKQFSAGASELSYAMVRDTSAQRRFAVSADTESLAPGVADAMLGFRQEMAKAGLGSSSVQTLGAVMSDPQASAGSRQGMKTVSLRSWESLELFNHLMAEAGSDQVMAQIGDGPAVIAAMPFASITLERGKSTLQYRFATSTAGSGRAGLDDTMPGAWLPIVSERHGKLSLERGAHQELGWSTTAGPAEMQLVIYADSIENPTIEGAGQVSASDAAGTSLLLDRASGIFRTAGPNYSTAGVLASVESRLPGDNRIRLSYASGDALVMHANAVPQSIALILNGTVARRAQMYSLAVSGTADGTGTRWRASYRWQPGGTVTEVAPFAPDAGDPYLNVSVRQPLWSNRSERNNRDREVNAGVEAQLDLRNLLAEGYQPFLTSDGSQLYFAQAQRCVRGGLAFTF